MIPMKTFQLIKLQITTGTIGGWTINADNITSPLGSVPPYGDGKKITLDSNTASIKLGAYSAGKRWNDTFKIWENDPNSGQFISSIIDPKGIDIKSDGNIIAAFRQMSAGKVAVHAEAPPDSIALSIRGRISIDGYEGLTGIIHFAPTAQSQRYYGARIAGGIIYETGIYNYSTQPPLSQPNRF
jgi:hypothetical protein